MEEVRGTTNLMRLVDRLRAEMTETYYDDNDDRMKTKRPTISLKFKETYGDAIFGTKFDLEVTLTQLRSVLEQCNNHLEDARVWMGNPYYQFTVFHSSYAKSIKIGMEFVYTNLRVMGDEAKYIGYKDSEGRTVLWKHTDDE